MTKLDVRLLGRVALSVDGAANAVTGLKPKSVLAVLVMESGRAVGFDSLAEQVWDGDPPESAMGGLQVFVSGLRKALRGPAGNSGLDTLLATSGRTYRLELDPQQSDIGRFEAARRRGADLAAAGRYDQASAAFAAGLAEFRGDPVADLRGLRFADVFAAALADARVAMAAAMYDAEIAAGRAAAVAGDLRRLVNENKTNEPLWGQLITALYLAGRQTDALHTVRELKAFIDETTAMDLTPALAELELKVLRQEPLDFAPAQAPQSGAAVDPSGRGFDKTESDSVAGVPLPRGVLVGPDGARHAVIGEVTLGRRPDNDIVVDDTKASRAHAVVSSTVAGFVVRDLMSSNGTRVGERRVRGTSPLSDGDRVTIGHTTFTFSVR